ncbi:hypothetical protein D7X87_18515 [bacterium D16-54]|nr:hypothetical protein D7X87_18515 [bacterium D16-54]RKJ12542.1 hypothetical protein D7X65_18675 [bacterium D16-56]
MEEGKPFLYSFRGGVLLGLWKGDGEVGGGSGGEEEEKLKSAFRKKRFCNHICCFGRNYFVQWQKYFFLRTLTKTQ